MALPAPWSLPDFEWDEKLPEWDVACHTIIPNLGTAYDNQTLFNAVKTKTGREVLRSALNQNQLRLHNPDLLSSCEAALLAHHSFQATYRRNQIHNDRNQRAAQEKAERLAKRTAEREASAEIKKQALYQKELARQERVRLKEAKVAEANAKRILAQISGQRSGKKRKTDMDASPSSSESSEDGDISS